jgi:hypothetical protein
VIRENPASRGTETSAEVLVGPPWRMVSNAGQQQWYEGGHPLQTAARGPFEYVTASPSADSSHGEWEETQRTHRWHRLSETAFENLASPAYGKSAGIEVSAGNPPCGKKSALFSQKVPKYYSSPLYLIFQMGTHRPGLERSFDKDQR